MRRPIKYKTKRAARNRLIAVVAASVLGVGVIGGAMAAALLTTGEDAPGTGVPTQTESSFPFTDTDTDPTDTDPTDTDPTDTDLTDTDPIDTDPIDTDPIDTDPIDTDPIDTDPVDTEPTDTDTTVSDDPGTDPGSGSVSSTENYRGGYLDLSDYPTVSALRDAADALYAQGYTAVMVEMKYDNGKLAYRSSVEEAKTYGANPTIAALTAEEIVDALHEAGLYVTARVCALRDDIAVKGNTAAALMNVAGFRYSDGASRWISVYSEDGTDYILALLSELQRAGVDEIMLRHYALPADTGTTAPKYDPNVSKTAAVESFISRVDALLSDTALNLEMDAVTIVEGGNSTQGIRCEALSAYAASVTADITLSNLYDGMVIGGKTIADVDADVAQTVKTVMLALETSALNIRPLLELTGDSAKDAAQIAVAQSLGCGAYQMIARVLSMNEK